MRNALVLSLGLVIAGCGGTSSRSKGDGAGGAAQGGSASGAGGSRSGAGGSANGGNSGSMTGGGAGASAGGSTSGGTAGNAGSETGGDAGALTGGSAGSEGGEGGTAGSVPTGGSAGNAGSGGAAGSAGQPGTGRECQTADDCRMISDCCNCMAIPNDDDAPECNLLCIDNQCRLQGVELDEVTCSFGRCVIDRSCDPDTAACDEVPEPCPTGFVRSVTDGCFGACIPPTECRNVSDCESCNDAVCVAFEAQIPSYGCVLPESSCKKGNYCECLDACPASGGVCSEADDGVHCACLVC